MSRLSATPVHGWTRSTPPLAWAPLLAFLIVGVVTALHARTPFTSNRVSGSPYPPAPYQAERIFGNLGLDHPVEFRFVPGTRQLFVADQGGNFWSVDTAASTPQAQPVGRMRDWHQPLDGVLGFAFHPGFATNRFIFINYNEPGGRTNGSHVSRFTLSSVTPPRIDPSSEKVIIRWLSGGHNGCTLAFGPDGFLYISTGDAANPDPPDMPYRTGQDISDLLSSVLRIDPDHPGNGLPYSIPADNPFIHLKDARPEVWAFGFRNPFRMSIDATTGDVWVGDVGWEQWEMVHRVVRGGNYGWSITEGPNLKVRGDIKQGPGPILPPVTAISHVDGASITGGVVYRGKRLPKLNGAYIYGDWETGRFWALRHNQGVMTSNDELCDTSLKPVSFLLDPDGELLILDYNGGIYQLIPNAAAAANAAFPKKLSETGWFTSVRPLKPASGVEPYKVRAPMWNDHARADLLIAIPGEDPIVSEGGVGNITGGTPLFPLNTSFIRTLTLELEEGNPASARRVETQVMHWDGQAWNPYTYRWNADQSDADLVGLQGASETFTVKDAAAPGGVRETPWRFLSRAECLRCHNAWAGEIISLTPLELGPPGADPAKSELSRLQAAGLYVQKTAPREPLREFLVNPYEPLLPAALRARSWLHANCAGCHRFGAGGAAAIHLNFDKPLDEARAIDEKPLRGDFGIPQARIIASGDPYRSTLFLRVRTEGSGHMPYIGSRLVDEAGTLVLRDWIRSLRPVERPGSLPSEEVRAEEQRNQTLVSRLNGADLEPTLKSLLATPSGALRLLQEVSSPLIRAQAARLAGAHTNSVIRDLLQQWLPPTERRQTLGLDIAPATVLSLTGDVNRGRTLFSGAAQCSRCHALGGEGRAFGPDLTLSSRTYSRAQLLDQILQPSKVIAPGFISTQVTLKDDRELTGFIVRREPASWVLRDETLVEHKLPVADIKESRESALSAMPDGLLSTLTAQEAADLLDYLVSLKGK